jgi:hypothetical protein
VLLLLLVVVAVVADFQVSFYRCAQVAPGSALRSAFRAEECGVSSASITAAAAAA